MSQLGESALARYGDTIREAGINDIDEIMQIWLTENIRTHNFIRSDYWQQNYPTVEVALPQAEVYVYACKGEIIGFIGVNGNYIEGIFVKASEQHNGIGSALLNKVKSIRSNLTLSVYKRNVNAVAFYLKNDFTITNEGTDDDTNESEYTMQWGRI